MVDGALIERAVSELANVPGTQFDARFLVEDVIGVALAFDEPQEFEAAIASTVRMLGLIVADRVSTSPLLDDYAGWECCHYQHRAARGMRATMRIMFTRVDGAVRVRGFGNRRLPADFYRRMSSSARLSLGDSGPSGA